MGGIQAETKLQLTVAKNPSENPLSLLHKLDKLGTYADTRRSRSSSGDFWTHVDVPDVTHKLRVHFADGAEVMLFNIQDEVRSLLFEALFPRS